MSKIEKPLEKRQLEKWDSRKNEKKPSVLKDVPLRGEHELIHSKTKVVKLKRKHLSKNRLITFIGNTRAADYYNLLVNKLLEGTNQKVPLAIMVTSAMDGEGKTVTTINLSISIAKLTKKKIFMIDADLRNPKFQSYFNCYFEKGLSDYLNGKERLSDLIVSLGSDDIFLLPSGRSYAGYANIFDYSKMEKLFDEIKFHCPNSYVICDSSPVLLASDAIFLSKHVDGVLVVVESGKTTRDQITEAMALLENKNIYGLVMNKAKIDKNKYYHY